MVENEGKLHAFLSDFWGMKFSKKKLASLIPFWGFPSSINYCPTFTTLWLSQKWMQHMYHQNGNLQTFDNKKSFCLSLASLEKFTAKELHCKGGGVR